MLFAQTLRTIKNKAHVNEKLQCGTEADYKREIERLAEEQRKLEGT